VDCEESPSSDGAMLKTFQPRVNLKSGDFEKKIQILKYEIPNEANFIENLKDSHLTPLGFLVEIQGFGGVKGGGVSRFSGVDADMPAQLLIQASGQKNGRMLPSTHSSIDK
jgi:hypothetical protein